MQIQELQFQVDKLLGMVDKMEKWREALNPVVSILLEQMGEGNGRSALENSDGDIESWLDLNDG